MKIANIIYENELVNHDMVEYINYYNEPLEYNKLVTVIKNLPTLYVGWSFMKKCNLSNVIIQNADILDKKILKNKLYWEYSFDENKTSHINGIENFVKIAPNIYFEFNYQYINLDPVFFQIKNLNDLIVKLPPDFDRVYNYKNKMLYVLKNDKIWGVDIIMYSFFNFNVSDIINIFCNRTSKYIDDLDGNVYIKYSKILPNYTFLKRYIVTQ